VNQQMNLPNTIKKSIKVHVSDSQSSDKFE